MDRHLTKVSVTRTPRGSAGGPIAKGWSGGGRLVIKGSKQGLCRSVVIIVLACVAARRSDAASSNPTMEEKVFIASHIYASIRDYFAHFEDLTNFDLDREYREYLGEVVRVSERRAFDFATMELVAKLHNSRTSFVDRWLSQNNPPLGFTAQSIQGRACRMY